MSKEQVKIDIEEVEPTLEEVEKQAAKQLLLELKMIKQKIYDSGTVMNSMLVVQIKQLLRGLVTKYNNIGLLIGENVSMKMNGHGKYASFSFLYTPRLDALFAEIVSELPKPGVETVEPNSVE
jgi:hypothetical protein